MPPFYLVLGQDNLSPTDVGGTVDGLSPKWQVVSLPLPHSGHTLLLVSQLAAVYHILFIFFSFLSLSFTSRYRSVLILLLLPWCNACYTLRLSLTPPPFQQPWNFNPTQVQSL